MFDPTEQKIPGPRFAMLVLLSVNLGLPRRTLLEAAVLEETEQGMCLNDHDPAFLVFRSLKSHTFRTQRPMGEY